MGGTRPPDAFVRCSPTRWMNVLKTRPEAAFHLKANSPLRFPHFWRLVRPPMKLRPLLSGLLTTLLVFPAIAQQPSTATVAEATKSTDDLIGEELNALVARIRTKAE